MSIFYKNHSPNELRAELEKHIDKLGKVFEVTGQGHYAGARKIIVDKIGFYIYVRYQELGASEIKDTWFPIDALEANFKELIP